MSRPKAGRRERRTFPIVGIGASAGGLEAVSRLLAGLPDDTGMAFVVVQHLDPTRESLLPMILQKKTGMPVNQAKDGGSVEPDRVYIIPPNAHMVIAGNRLRLIPRPAGAQAASVNCFLASLAEERGNKAIAVILSGTASDGAAGVRAVKSEGGLVFAQDERSAGYFGMPQSAAATGSVDFIMPPEKIAAELAGIARHPVLAQGMTQGLEDPPTLGKIFLLLRRATGVDFGLYKPSTIKRRLLRRLMLHRLDSVKRYAERLEEDADEVHALHDDLLIHVTRFFREPKAVAALRAKALARILKGLPPDSPIRVWVPGCSSGEEAYSLAITLLDYLSERANLHPLQVFATDISEAALERARAGVYPAEVENQVPPRLLRRFFTKTDRGYSVARRVRDACVFARHDLTSDPPFGSMDLISCCNVLIYLSSAAQRRILPAFHYALRPSGVLLLGGSETVGESAELFTAADKNHRFYYKKALAAPRSFPFGVRHGGAAVPKGTSPKSLGFPPGAWPEADLLKVAERILLARYAPASVIIDGDSNVIHFRGRTSRFLEPVTGKADLSLLRMLPPHTADAVRGLLQRAKKADAPVLGDGIGLGDGDGGRAREASVEVIPFRLPTTGARFFIVLFEEAAAGSPARRPRGEAAPKADAPALKRLRSELAATRAFLQTVSEEHGAALEELKSANEEIISSNEELQSTNEELEIAKEELQAANEELTTVNDELQTRNTDLGQVNDDLVNLIASVHLPIIMVSSDLRIRRFSPAAETVMRLAPGDVGRPIGDIRPKLALPNIEELLHEVIETVSIKELAVKDKDGHLFSVRIRPYRTTENKIDGAVLVFIDSGPAAAARSKRAEP